MFRFTGSHSSNNLTLPAVTNLLARWDETTACRLGRELLPTLMWKLQKISSNGQAEPSRTHGNRNWSLQITETVFQDETSRHAPMPGMTRQQNTYSVSALLILQSENLVWKVLAEASRCQGNFLQQRRQLLQNDRSDKDLRLGSPIFSVDAQWA